MPHGAVDLARSATSQLTASALRPGADLRCDGLELGARARGHRDVRALASEGERDCAADAPAAAGDERDPVPDLHGAQYRRRVRRQVNAGGTGRLPAGRWRAECALLHERATRSRRARGAVEGGAA